MLTKDYKNKLRAHCGIYSESGIVHGNIISEDYKTKLKTLSGIITENDKFERIKGKMYQAASKDVLDNLFNTIDSLPEEQKDIVKNTFSFKAKDDDAIGDLIFKLKNTISVFKK